MNTPPLVLLGPQRREPRVRQAVERLGLEGPIALISAGWEEREAEHGELEEHLGRPVVNLEPYRRGEDVFAEDRELFEVMHERHDELRELQKRYRLRLAHALAAARELFALDPDAPGVAEDLEEALAAVRTLDHAHLERVRGVQAHYAPRLALDERASLRRHRDELRAKLDAVQGVCVAGGHVAILLNRIRMFGLGPALAERALLAWAGGAMVCSERIVLFHDSPPQGPGDAEVFDRGLGLARGLVCLPHASQRLRLRDATRVALMARRFSPARCAALDPPAELERDGVEWVERGTTSLLSTEGVLEPAGAA